MIDIHLKRFVECDSYLESGKRVELLSTIEEKNRNILSEISQIDIDFIRVIYNKKEINVIDPGQYLFFIYDDNYNEQSIILYLNEVNSVQLKKHAIMVKESDYVEILKEKISKKLNISIENRVVRIANQILENDKSCADYGMKDVLKQDVDLDRKSVV